MAKTLLELRETIDGIDSAIHDLLIKRSEIVEEIGKIKAVSRAENKTSKSNWRVGRECEVIKKRLQHHHGIFPIDSLIRIWREMISASLRIEGDFAVSSVSVENNHLLKTIHDFFGSYVRILFHHSCQDAVSDVKNELSSAAVLPLLAGDKEDVWWRNELPLKIMLKLPFVADNASCVSFVLSEGNYNITEKDATLLYLQTDNEKLDISEILSETGIEIHMVESVFEKDYLLALRGYFSESDIKKTIKNSHISKVRVLGWYPIIM